MAVAAGSENRPDDLNTTPLDKPHDFPRTPFRSGNVNARRAAGGIAFNAALSAAVYPAAFAYFECGELGVSCVLFLDFIFTAAPAEHTTGILWRRHGRYLLGYRR